jgi:signal transduction histidine kinase
VNHDFYVRLADILASSIDEPAMLAAVAGIAVPELGERAIADTVGDDGVVTRVAGGLDEWKIPLTAGLRAGEPVVIPDLTPATLASLAPAAPAQAALRDAGVRTLAVLPLRGRSRLLGLLAVMRTGSAPLDVARLLDLARRTALGLDNARLYERARQASRTRDDTLGVVSHDLRNGLNTVLTAVGLLLRSLPPDTEGRRDRKHVEAIRRSAERMNRLIGDLLDVASIESGRLFVDPQFTPVRPLVKEAVDAVRGAAGEKSLRLEYAVAGSPAVVCDRDRLLQVLDYLIDNAIKFTPEGGSVRVSVEPVDGVIRFAVRDSGVGVSSQQLPHIFDRFWQATPKARLGSGLGLTIAKGVVEALNGTIWVESEEGAGTTFYFTMPAAELPSQVHAQ